MFSLCARLSPHCLYGLTVHCAPTSLIPVDVQSSRPEQLGLTLLALPWRMFPSVFAFNFRPQGFAALLEQLQDGVFLCWLVGRVTGKPLMGAWLLAPDVTSVHP